MNWETKFSGSIWQVKQAQHASGKTFEKAVRSPGSRIIFTRDAKILLNKETRHELGGKSDYRLPGGKVFDTSAEYIEFLESGKDIIDASRVSIVKESLEEVGIVVAPEALTYVGVDILGATCEWDLHYWRAEIFSENESGAKHHESEADEIEGSEWVSFADARALALNPARFAESRSARILLSVLRDIQ